MVRTSPTASPFSLVTTFKVNVITSVFRLDCRMCQNIKESCSSFFFVNTYIFKFRFTLKRKLSIIYLTVKFVYIPSVKNCEYYNLQLCVLYVGVCAWSTIGPVNDSPDMLGNARVCTLKNKFFIYFKHLLSVC